jgi:hypothetical protein
MKLRTKYSFLVDVLVLGVISDWNHLAIGQIWYLILLEETHHHGFWQKADSGGGAIPRFPNTNRTRSFYSQAFMSAK